MQIEIKYLDASGRIISSQYIEYREIRQILRSLPRTIAGCTAEGILYYDPNTGNRTAHFRSGAPRQVEIG